MTGAAKDIRFGIEVTDIPANAPSHDVRLVGQHVTIAAAHPDHAEDLYDLVGDADHFKLFDYLFDEHPESLDTLRSQLEKKASTTNPWSYTILLNETTEAPAKAVGMSSLMRMDLPNRVIEIGSILYTPALQRTAAATEAMYLLARHVFEDLGFRRYEWKCNSLNTPSRRAAARLGFTYEGTFRQHMIARGRNRDTAWFSLLDSEWQKAKEAFEAWLDKSNFDTDGKQKRKLEDFRGAQLPEM